MVLRGHEPTCQGKRRRRCGFGPWVGKTIPWRRAGEPTPVSLPENPHGQRRLAGCSPQGSPRLGHAILNSSALLRNAVLAAQVSAGPAGRIRESSPSKGRSIGGYPRSFGSLPSSWRAAMEGSELRGSLRSVKGLCHLRLPSHVVLALSLSRQSCCHRVGAGLPPRGAHWVAVTGTSALPSFSPPSSGWFPVLPHQGAGERRASVRMPPP